MEHVVIICSRFRLFLCEEWILPREAIVRNSDLLAVPNRVPLIFWRKPLGELGKRGKLWADVETWTVHEHT